MTRGRGRREDDVRELIDPTREARYVRWLFLETCHDVERRSEYGQQHSAYETLLLGFLLRKLFLDGTPLVERVRRLHPTSLQFAAVPWTPVASDGPAFGAHGKPLLRMTGECFDPDTLCEAGAHGPAETVDSVGRLLKTAVGDVGSRRVTLHDLVRNAANALGGVHLGPSQSLTDSYLKWAMSSTAWAPTREIAAPVLCLRAAGRVALRGLRPLMETAATIQ